MAAVPAYDCSYAGVPFRMPTKAVCDFVDRHGLLTQHADTMAADSVSSKFFNRKKWPTRRPRLGEFFCPFGMARCSTFYGIMAGVDVDKVAKIIFRSTLTGGFDYATFRMKADGLGGTQYIQHKLAMLPPQPLAISGDGADDGLYLVTLVDDRYWRCRKHTSDSSPTITCDTYALLDDTSTWSLLMSVLASNMVAVWTEPTSISSVYGTPEPDSPLYGSLEPPTITLDAVAANLGGFVCRSPSTDWQSYKFQSWNAALTATQTAREDLATRLAGGAILQPDTSIADKFRLLTLPTVVRVLFPLWETGKAFVEPTAYRLHRKTGGSYGACWNEAVSPSALGEPYSTILTGGRTERDHVIRTTAKALIISGGNVNSTPTNTTTITNLATQLAKDFYDCELAALDEVYQGIQDWPLDTGHDIIWTWTEDGATTHIQRLPYNSAPDEFQHSFGNIQPKQFVGLNDLPDGSGCSVLARAANSTGVRADVVAANDQFLVRRSNVLTFATLAVTDIPALSGLTAATPATSDIVPINQAGTNKKATIADILALQTLPGLMSTVPASSSSTGTAGQMARDSIYLYVCYATNTWGRIALDTSAF